MPLVEHRPSHAVGPTLYQLNAPEVIGQILQEILQQGSGISLYPLPYSEAGSVGSGDVVEDVNQTPIGIARIVALEESTSIVEWEAPTLLQPSVSAVCAIAHLNGGVRVQCILEGHWQAGHNSWILRAPWPTEILQCQRRRYQRYSVPLGQSYTVSFSFGSTRHELDIDDMSLGGVALRGTRKETAMLFMGKTLRNVTIHLPHGYAFVASLKVHSRRAFKSFLLGEQVLVGCAMELKNPPDDFESYLFAMQSK